MAWHALPDRPSGWYGLCMRSGRTASRDGATRCIPAKANETEEAAA